MEEEIQEILATYRSSVHDDKIFFHPHIPPKKLANATPSSVAMTVQTMYWH